MLVPLKNKREIPKQFLPSKHRDIGFTLYGFAGQNTLLSHVPKKNKAVILLSSMHHTEAIDKSTGKPEIIEFYNKTKGGVDEIYKTALFILQVVGPVVGQW